MATTTNYGWTTPDDTALVKDGAAAIRTLGTSVDTTTKNLNPSTTLGDIEYRSSTANTNTRLGIGSSGQSLTVVAGVPSWAASPTSVLTTTGDTLYASGANTLARRAIGSSGDVLTVSGGVPTWVAPAGGGANYTLLNAGGTSLSGSSVTISGISGKDKLIVLVRAGSSTGTSDFAIQLNGDTGTNYGQWGLAINTYNLPTTYSKLSVAGAFEGYGNNPTSLTTNKWNFAAPGDAEGQVNMFMRIEGCNSSGAKFMQQSSGASTGGVAPQNLMNQTGGIYTGSSTISSVTISCGSSPTFDGGTIYIYGSA